MKTLRPINALLLALSSVAALLGTGCGQPLEPSDLAGTYVLIAYNGAVPPQPATPGVVVVSDTLRLGRDGTGGWTSVRHVYSSSGPAREFERYDLRATVARRDAGLRLRVNIVCSVQDCRPPELDWVLVSLVGDRLFVGQPPTVLTLRRIAP